MNTQNYIKEVLSINKKALQYIHHEKGFNFQKPFEVIKFDKVITVNKLKNLVDVYKNNIAILAMAEEQVWFSDDTTAYKKKFYFVDFVKNNYFNSTNNNNKLYYDFDINYTFTKGEFEQGRKVGAYTYYIFVQDKAHTITPKTREKTIEKDTRYKFISHGYLTSYPKLGKSKITKIEVASGETRKNIFYKVQNGYYLNNDDITTDVNYFIDKSGYFKTFKRQENKQKIDAMKKEKAKIKADIYNCDEQNEQIKNDIEKLKALFIESVKNDDIKIFEIFNYRYSWILRDYKKHMQRYTNKEYDTASNIITTISNIQNDIFKMNEKLMEV